MLVNKTLILWQVMLASSNSILGNGDDANLEEMEEEEREISFAAIFS